MGEKGQNGLDEFDLNLIVRYYVTQDAVVRIQLLFSLLLLFQAKEAGQTLNFGKISRVSYEP